MVCRIVWENTILLSSRFQVPFGCLRPVRCSSTTPLAFWSLKSRFFMKICPWFNSSGNLVCWFLKQTPRFNTIIGVKTCPTVRKLSRHGVTQIKVCLLCRLVGSFIFFASGSVVGWVEAGRFAEELIFSSVRLVEL